MFRMKIDWQEVNGEDYNFIGFAGKEEVRLRLNDFPDEVLCTIYWSGGQYDIDDIGKYWILPLPPEEPFDN